MTPFPVGFIHNPIIALDSPPDLNHAKRIKLRYPSRLEAMCLDPSKILYNRALNYPAGQINVCVDLCKVVTIEKRTDQNIIIDSSSGRFSLIRHAALLMKSALNIVDGWSIKVSNEHEMRHVGLGSSSSLIASVMAAINALYHHPIAPLTLVRYAAQNHGEEIDNDDEHLYPVQCIGGSAICGHFKGGLQVVAGAATPIFLMHLPDDLSVIIALPPHHSSADAAELMMAEEAMFESFDQAGIQYSQEIAYRMIHEVLPGLVKYDLEPCKQLVYDYRWKMGSIRNCAFSHPQLMHFASLIEPLVNDDEVHLLSLSSVGPVFFALTTAPDRIMTYLNTLGFSTMRTEVYNETYSIIESE